jgi:hypothetical protein
MRGSPVDRSDWKSYILPLMLFKRICDVWDGEFEEAVKTYGETLPTIIISGFQRDVIGMMCASDHPM